MWVAIRFFRFFVFWFSALRRTDKEIQDATTKALLRRLRNAPFNRHLGLSLDGASGKTRCDTTKPGDVPSSEQRSPVGRRESRGGRCPQAKGVPDGFKGATLFPTASSFFPGAAFRGRGKSPALAGAPLGAGGSPRAPKVAPFAPGGRSLRRGEFPAHPKELPRLQKEPP